MVGIQLKWLLVVNAFIFVHFLHVSFFYVLNGMDIVCSNNKHLTQMRSVNSHTRDRMSVDVCVSVCLYIPAAVDCVYLGVSFCGIVLWRETHDNVSLVHLPW